MNNGVAPSGWYAQPDGTERWWDGQVWTEQVRPVASNVPAVAWQTPAAPQYPQQYGQPFAQPFQAPVVAARNPALALIASFFITGLGQLINGEVGKGIAMFVAAIVTWFMAFLLMIVLIGFLLIPVALAIWVWSMVDAYNSARNWNARHGIVS